MPALTEIKTDQYSFQVYAADQLDADRWRELQALQRQAFAASFIKYAGQAGIDHFVHWTEPDYFRESRLEPQLAVDRGELNPGLFSKPRVVVAYDGIDPIGYIYSADNTSGENMMPYLKMYMPPTLKVPVIGGKRYAWQREVAVHPDVRGQGVAQVLGYFSMAERNKKQKAAAYVWPTHNPDAFKALLAYGFKTTDQTRVDPFKTGKTMHQARMVAPVGQVMERILKLPGAVQSIVAAKSSQ